MRANSKELPSGETVLLDTKKYLGNQEFTVFSKRELKNEELAYLQEKAGFHPLGYGGPSLVFRNEKNGVYTTSWQCSGSCD